MVPGKSRFFWPSRCRPSGDDRRAGSAIRAGSAAASAAHGRWAGLIGSWSGRWVRGVGLLLVLALVAGCAGTSIRKAASDRPFVFRQDSFAYRNDLVWVYEKDPVTGKMRHRDREPRPDYVMHCFVVARSARQFFQHARFDPSAPVADEATYRKLIRRVVHASPRRDLARSERIVIPGYTNLYSFSQMHERLLKAECGGAWQSYFQRGHWRMVFPFCRSQQERNMQRFCEEIRRHQPPVVHLVRFPQLTINHAVLLYDVHESENDVRFATYDPYRPDEPAELVYDRRQRRFEFAGNDYFVGGWVNAYEVYCRWNY